MAVVSDFDLLDFYRCSDRVTTCSKEDLLICLSAMDESDIKAMVIASMRQSQSKPSEETVGFTKHIKAHFAENSCASEHPFTSLPSEIGAYIISFSNMYDRIKQELICKDLYKFCQVPSARYHLIIDQKFAKGLYSNSIHIRKFFNAQYVEIKYVFRDTIHETFEKKYYSLISQIFSNSRSLHTLNWKLTYKQFRCKLNSTLKADYYYGHTGHILEWIHNLGLTFPSVTTLIYTPSQFKRDSRFSAWRKKLDLFRSAFPNMESFIIPQRREYSENIDRADHDFEWQIFKDRAYQNKIRVIDCDLAKRTTSLRYWNERHIKVQNHPLSHYYKFSQLVMLRLKLLIFPGCRDYYHSIINDGKSSTKCLNLRYLSMSFEYAQNPTVSMTTNVPDELCKFVLSHCPNVTNYTFLTNDLIRNASYTHLMGFYDRIEVLTTDTQQIFRTARMFSLKVLKLKVGSSFVPSFDLNQFRNLISFECTHSLGWRSKSKVNQNITEWINHILIEQKETSKLRHIGIYHEGNDKKRRQKNFNLVQSKEQSLALCKLLISLSMDKNVKIESIALNPVKFHQKELEYLYFWFSDKIKTSNECSVTSDIVLTDLFCNVKCVRD